MAHTILVSDCSRGPTRRPHAKHGREACQCCRLITAGSSSRLGTISRLSPPSTDRPSPRPRREWTTAYRRAFPAGPACAAGPVRQQEQRGRPDGSADTYIRKLLCAIVLSNTRLLADSYRSAAPCLVFEIQYRDFSSDASPTGRPHAVCVLPPASAANCCRRAIVSFMLTSSDSAQHRSKTVYIVRTSCT
ncbi:hypothetical protein K466DRAFT_380939 [Polyporus arcularius HHB13444]|uniref:Uncharacterized protein n=1 Tax=Polyporus arcularius HHB13444 TaxID=1314778 RepID=A0A5C3PRQ4_9APHY|nr:hypothetical protein K466DRAFT_380939 [Polyporus arcularius HHB13444]